MDIKTIIIIVIGIAVLALLAVWIWYMRRHSSDDDEMFDDMDGAEFEQLDIIADRDGISYAIQCKCYSDPIGIKAIQEAYAGKDYYNAMIGAVMTNQSFTKTAKEFADKLNIVLWDGDYVMDLIHEVAIPEKKSMIDLFRNLRKKTNDQVSANSNLGNDNDKTDIDADKHVGQ